VSSHSALSDATVQYVTRVSFKAQHAASKAAVCVVYNYGVSDRGSIPGRDHRSLLYPLPPDQLRGPPSLLTSGLPRPLSRGQSAADAWSWPLTPSNAKIKNEWSYTSSPPQALDFVHRGQLYFNSGCFTTVCQVKKLPSFRPKVARYLWKTNMHRK
jgi:hypothetical protein